MFLFFVLNLMQTLIGCSRELELDRSKEIDFERKKDYKKKDFST